MISEPDNWTTLRDIWCMYPESDDGARSLKAQVRAGQTRMRLELFAEALVNPGCSIAFLWWATKTRGLEAAFLWESRLRL